MGLCEVLFAVFLVLKLIGVIAWSWFWVCSPLIIIVILVIIAILIHAFS